MERFGINTFSSIPASGSTPAYNPWGSQGDYSAQGVIDCINLPRRRARASTMVVREYHSRRRHRRAHHEPSDVVPRDLIKRRARSVYRLVRAAAAAAALHIAGMTAPLPGRLRRTRAVVTLNILINEPNGNGVTPAAAIARRCSTYQAPPIRSDEPDVNNAIAGLPFAEGYFDGYANGNADTNNVHLYPTIPPDLTTAANRVAGRDRYMLQGSNMVFGTS